MKLKYNFAVREIAEDFVLVPLGTAALKLSGMITTNAVGAFLWEQLMYETTVETMVKRLVEEFEVDDVTAAKDVQEFVSRLQELDLVE